MGRNKRDRGGCRKRGGGGGLKVTGICTNVLLSDVGRAKEAVGKHSQTLLRKYSPTASYRKSIATIM